MIFCSVINLTILQNLCNVSRKKGVVKSIFCMQINVKFFYRLMLSISLGKASHAQRSNGLVVKVLDFKYSGSTFKTAG